MWHKSLSAAQGYWQRGGYVVLHAWPCGLFSIAKMKVLPCEERQSGCLCGCKLCWDSGDLGCLLGFLFFRILLSHPYTSIVQKHREVALHAHRWGQKLYGCSKGDEGPPSLAQPASFRALIRSVKPREEIAVQSTGGRDR